MPCMRKFSETTAVFVIVTTIDVIVFAFICLSEYLSIIHPLCEARSGSL